jgi:hypothetical protein
MAVRCDEVECSHFEHFEHSPTLTRAREPERQRGREAQDHIICMLVLSFYDIDARCPSEDGQEAGAMVNKRWKEERVCVDRQVRHGRREVVSE